MKMLVCLVLGLSAVQAQAWIEMFDSFTTVPSYQLNNPLELICRYSFGSGRNSVTVEMEDAKSECTFSHTERRQPPGSSSAYYATYVQNYACTDGTSALYTTDFFGANLLFFYKYDPNQASLRCQ